MKQKITNLIIKWFKNNKRDFPWRVNSDPYRVWVSEVMLQQTQAGVVVDYFQRWMVHFPTLESLASAKEEEVIKAWEGLGYYRRAKMLQSGARFIMNHFNGKIPNDKEKLLLIPGIGPYTAGAIVLFAFKQRAIAIDGNVQRVICRLFGIEDDPSLRKTARYIESCVEMLTPDRNPHLLGEGLIELGALICNKKALCSLCPIKAECKAYATDLVHLVPNKRKAPPITPLFFQVFLWVCDGWICICPPSKEKRFGELYTFPKKQIDSKEGLPPFEGAIPLEPVTHFFTRFKATLIPWICPITSRQECPSSGIWVRLTTLDLYPFPSGERTIKNYLSLHPSFC